MCTDANFLIIFYVIAASIFRLQSPNVNYFVFNPNDSLPGKTIVIYGSSTLSNSLRNNQSSGPGSTYVHIGIPLSGTLSSRDFDRRINLARKKNLKALAPRYHCQAFSRRTVIRPLRLSENSEARRHAYPPQEISPRLQVKMLS